MSSIPPTYGGSSIFFFDKSCQEERVCVFCDPLSLCEIKYLKYYISFVLKNTNFTSVTMMELMQDQDDLYSKYIHYLPKKCMVISGQMVPIQNKSIFTDLHLLRELTTHIKAGLHPLTFRYETELKIFMIDGSVFANNNLFFYFELKFERTNDCFSQIKVVMTLKNDSFFNCPEVSIQRNFADSSRDLDTVTGIQEVKSNSSNSEDYLVAEVTHVSVSEATTKHCHDPSNVLIPEVVLAPAQIPPFLFLIGFIAAFALAFSLN